MKQTKQNIALIFSWTLILGLATILFFFNTSMTLWEKGLIVASLALTAFLNIKNVVKNNKDFTLNEDILTIHQTFKKEERYGLGTVAAWAEYNYKAFGIDTGRRIFLRMENGAVIDLWYNSSSDFEKLSDYLNTNLPDLYTEEL